MFNDVPKAVINAQYEWGEADYEWSNDPRNKHLEYVAEEARKKYLRYCKKYGVKPVEGAMR